MAHTHPDGWQTLTATGAQARRIDTLARLARALPAAYTVYHAVHWSTLEGEQSIYGEIDFVLVNRAGDVLLIEQKAGLLDETDAGLVERHPVRPRQVAARIAQALHILRGKLDAALGQERGGLEYLFFCPDYHVRSPATAGIDAGRIVDAGRREALIDLIGDILPPGSESARAAKVHRLLRDILQLQPDVSALVGRAEAMVTRISGGLAHWGRRLDFSPFHLRVTGTAGSGKTQLALAEYQATLDAGKRPLYVCYNRPLADHFNAIVPRGGLACTFHMLCDLHLQSHGDATDFSAPGAFERLVERAAARPPQAALMFDTVIVDEGQDFSATWRDIVLRHAAPEARQLWLEDPLQNLYEQPPVDLPGWVTLRSEANYRSPRAIVDFLRPLLPEGLQIEAQSPFSDTGVDILTYRDTEQLRERVKEAIRRTYAAGFRKEDLAILSFRGHQHSALLHAERLGQTTLRTFTGGYDLLGQPEFTAGEVLVESVYRFKGQAAPAVILAEIDFDTLDTRSARKLFVGATRARLHLVLVMSERAAARLVQA